MLANWRYSASAPEMMHVKEGWVFELELILAISLVKTEIIN